MIKFMSLVKSLGLPEELVLEILGYLPYTYYKRLIICDLNTYIYWANKQLKYKTLGRNPSYKLKLIGGFKHSIGNKPCLTYDLGYAYYKFGLLHNSHGPAQLMTSLNNTRTVTIWNKYGFTTRKVFIGDINHDYNYNYGLRHDKYYTHGVCNVTTDVHATLDNDIDKIIRLIEIMTELEKRIIEVNFYHILLCTIGLLGDKKNPTYTSAEGDVVYMYNGIIHRFSGHPAVILRDGTRMYVRKGIIRKIVGSY